MLIVLGCIIIAGWRTIQRDLRDAQREREKELRDWNENE